MKGNEAELVLRCESFEVPNAKITIRQCSCVNSTSGSLRDGSIETSSLTTEFRSGSDSQFELADADFRFPPKADIHPRKRHVRKVRKSELALDARMKKKPPEGGF